MNDRYYDNPEGGHVRMLTQTDHLQVGSVNNNGLCINHESTFHNHFQSDLETGSITEKLSFNKGGKGAF